MEYRIRLKREGEITTKILFNLSFSPKHAFKNILNPFYPEKINYYTYNNCVYEMRFSLNLTLITAVVDYWLWIQIRTLPTNYCFLLIRKEVYKQIFCRKTIYISNTYLFILWYWTIILLWLFKLRNILFYFYCFYYYIYTNDWHLFHLWII